VKPLEKRVGALERTITQLERTIADHNDELSKPEVYDDATAQADLDRAFAEWTESNEKLEQLQAEIEAAS
jgi:flagellar biosynthesis chaperone FliJ